jgi:hypothetical protein
LTEPLSPAVASAVLVWMVLIIVPVLLFCGGRFR